IFATLNTASTMAGVAYAWNRRYSTTVLCSRSQCRQKSMYVMSGLVSNTRKSSIGREWPHARHKARSKRSLGRSNLRFFATLRLVEVSVDDVVTDSVHQLGIRQRAQLVLHHFDRRADVDVDLLRRIVPQQLGDLLPADKLCHRLSEQPRAVHGFAHAEDHVLFGNVDAAAYGLLDFLARLH